MKPILIVGAGPTGLAAALFLHERGVRVRVIDRAAMPSQQSKALAVNRRSLELLRRTGVSSSLTELGHRALAGNLWQGEHRRMRVDLPKRSAEPPGLLVLPQARTEAVLVEALESRGIAVERGVQFLRFDKGASNNRDSAWLRYADGRMASFPAAAVLGADGAHSRVRESLGIRFGGAALAMPWVLSDLRLRTPLAADEAHIRLFAHGFQFLLRIEGDVWRVISNRRELLRDFPAGSHAGETLWASDFTVSHRVAASWQQGAAFLAGDAAHLHSPIGARGMNLGIEDAWVFAALAAQGRLESYTRLRRHAVMPVVAGIRRISRFAAAEGAGATVARRLLPALRLARPLVLDRLRRMLMGHDHDVEPVPLR